MVPTWRFAFGGNPPGGIGIVITRVCIGFAHVAGSCNRTVLAAALAVNVPLPWHPNQ
jgi:hypothetical protein